MQTQGIDFTVMLNGHARRVSERVWDTLSEIVPPDRLFFSGSEEQGQDVAREILANSVNLYMSVVGHRTNEVMRRLTVVSVIFLPPTLIASIYGMNFANMPELNWQLGFLFSLGLMVSSVGLTFLFFRWKRLL